MKGFKAFYKGMICKGKSLCGEYEKQYAENTEYEESAAVICEKGMHFCKNPLDVFNFYPMIDDNGDFTEFAEVEALDKTETDDNKKFCTKKLKIGAKIDFMDYIKGAFKITYENIKSEVVEATKDAKDSGYDATLAGGDYSTLAGGESATLAGGESAKLAGGNYATLAGGNRATLAGGNRATLAGGYSAVLAGGESATLAGGDSAKLAGGDYSTLAGGDYSTLAGGDYSTLAGGYSAKLAGGNYATLAGGESATLAGGDYSTLAGGNYATLAGGESATLAGGDGSTLAGGYRSVLVGDKGSRAKGGKGSVIMLVQRDLEGNIISFKAEQVDGIRIKENVWYKLENGEFKEI